MSNNLKGGLIGTLIMISSLILLLVDSVTFELVI